MMSEQSDTLDQPIKDMFENWQPEGSYGKFYPDRDDVKQLF